LQRKRKTQTNLTSKIYKDKKKSENLGLELTLAVKNNFFSSTVLSSSKKD